MRVHAILSHLLIKSSVSRNPVSRRTNQSTQQVTPEAAIAELKEFQAKIKVRVARCQTTTLQEPRFGSKLSRAQAEGATEQVFAKYATERSDCGSFAQGGDLGVFGPGEMQKQFEDGTAALQPGEMSDIVLSDSGHHLIFRTR